LFHKPPVNNQIRAPQVRLIDENDHQVGIVSLKEALEVAWAKHLDLVQVTDKVSPPIAKITDFGNIFILCKKRKGR